MSRSSEFVVLIYIYKLRSRCFTTSHHSLAYDNICNVQLDFACKSVVVLKTWKAVSYLYTCNL